MTINVDGIQIDSLESTNSPVKISGINVEASSSSIQLGVVDVYSTNTEALVLNPIGPVNSQAVSVEAVYDNPIGPVYTQANVVDVLHNGLPFEPGISVQAISIEVLRVVPGRLSRGPMNVVAN